VLLLALVVLAASTEVVVFGEGAVNAIFKEKKEALVLFTDGNGQEVQDAFAAAAAADQSDRLYTTVDNGANADHFRRFGEYLGVNVAETPVVVLLKEAKNKFLSTDPVTEEGIAAFLAKVESGEVTKLLKSAPVPENDVAPVKTFVGKNYHSTIQGDEREYLVKIYAPWCGHCKSIAPHFVAAATALANNPNVVLAEFDGTLNEVDGVDISGYPTILWYPKDKTAEPIKFNGERDTEGIIDWIKDHTQHEWVEPAQPEE
jgi:protein disulfide-isomerase A1